MEKIKINEKDFNRTTVSKYIQKLADKHQILVDAFIESDWDGNGRSRKVYRFHGAFLSDFEALTREVKGYEVTNEFGQGFLIASEKIKQ